MKRSMLDYCKLVLEKFSFSPPLFRKEYRKSLRFLDPVDHCAFRNWVREKFKKTSAPDNTRIVQLPKESIETNNKKQRYG